MEPSFILLFAFGEYPKKIAVVQIQCPEAGGLFAAFPVPRHTVSFCFSDRFRQGPCRSGLFQDAPTDALQRVFLAKVPGQPYKAGLARWPDGNILAHMDFITFPVKILKELPLGHGLTDDLIYITTDKSPPCG